MTRYISIILLSLLLGQLKANGQEFKNQKKLEEFNWDEKFVQRVETKELINSGANQVRNAEKIFWFGLDFSLLKYNPNYLDQNKVSIPDAQKIIDVYCPAWGQYFYDSYGIKNVSKKLKKELVPKLDEVQPLYTRLSADSFLVDNQPRLTADEIGIQLKTYELSESNGIGMVVIQRTVFKPYEMVIGYVVFFDLATKTPLWIVEVETPSSGAGMTRHWGVGFYRVVHYFLKQAYKR